MDPLYKNASRVLIFTVTDDDLQPVNVAGTTGKIYIDATGYDVSPEADQVNRKGQFRFTATKINTTSAISSGKRIRFRHTTADYDDILVDVEIPVLDSPIPAS